MHGTACRSTRGDVTPDRYYFEFADGYKLTNPPYRGDVEFRDEHGNVHRIPCYGFIVLDKDYGPILSVEEARKILEEESKAATKPAPKDETPATAPSGDKKPDEPATKPSGPEKTDAGDRKDEPPRHEAAAAEPGRTMTDSDEEEEVVLSEKVHKPYRIGMLLKTKDGNPDGMLLERDGYVQQIWAAVDVIGVQNCPGGLVQFICDKSPTSQAWAARLSFLTQELDPLNTDPDLELYSSKSTYLGKFKRHNVWFSVDGSSRCVVWVKTGTHYRFFGEGVTVKPVR
jgi:hypothetical protein